MSVGACFVREQQVGADRALGKTWKGEQEGSFNGDKAPG